MIVLLLVLSAMELDEDEAPDCPGHVDEIEIDEVVVGSGWIDAAPWDPYRVVVDGATWAEPVVSADGYLPLEDVLVPDTVTTASNLYRPTEDRTDVDAALAGLWLGARPAVWETDLETCATPQTTKWVDGRGSVFGHVGTFGRDPTFDPEAILGSWDVSPELVYASTDADASILGSFLRITLEVLAVGDGAADIRILADGGDGACVVLADTAALSDEGELTWSKERIDVPTEPAALTLYNPTFRLGFDAEGLYAAGGEVSVLADVRATLGTEFDGCELVGAFGGACVPCVDGTNACLGLAGFAWTADHTEESVGADLPFCGADFTDTGVVPTFPEITCEPTCPICMAAWLVPMIPLLRRRRGAYPCARVGVAASAAVRLACQRSVRADPCADQPQPRISRRMNAAHAMQGSAKVSEPPANCPISKAPEGCWPKYQPFDVRLSSE